MPKPPRKKVGKWRLRCYFNSNRYWARLKEGEFTAKIENDPGTHLKRGKNDEPYCTHSQLVTYIDADGEQVALVHQYLRLDGTLGARRRRCWSWKAPSEGQPDPKLVLHEGVMYHERGPSQVPTNPVAFYLWRQYVRCVVPPLARLRCLLLGR